MQKSNQNIAMLYCMVIGTAKTFLKHIFLTKCFDTEGVLTHSVLAHLSSSFPQISICYLQLLQLIIYKTNEKAANLGECAI